MSPVEPIRILRIIARLNIGGPAVQAILLSEYFSGGPYQTLLVCGKVGSYEGDMSYLAQSKGVRPLVLPGLGRDISALRDFRSLQDLGRIIRQFRPHIIHTHTAKAGTLGRLAGMSFNAFRGSQARIRLVHTFHGHVFHSYFGSLKTFLFIQIEKFLARFTDRIVVISPGQQKEICERFRIAGREKVKVIRLGFELSPFREGERRGADVRQRYLPDASPEATVVGIIGRLTQVKNHRMFLEGVKYLKNMNQDHPFRFLVIGDGELRQELMCFVKKEGLEGLVVFTGWQKDMPSLYGALDIVVLTSLNEGTPVTLIEAMAAGKPVIATDVGGVRDLLGPLDSGESDGYKLAQNGVLIPTGREEVLAQALLRLSKDRDLSKRMAENAQSFVLHHYSKERLVGDLELLYAELVKS